MKFERGDIVRLKSDQIASNVEPAMRDFYEARRYIVLGVESHGFSFEFDGKVIDRPKLWKIWDLSWSGRGFVAMVAAHDDLIPTGDVAREVTR